MKTKKQVKNRALVKKAEATTIDSGSVSANVVLKSVEKGAKPLIKKLMAFKIKTKEDYQKAFALTKDLKNIGKIAKDQLGTVVGPNRRIRKEADASIKAANAIFAPFFNLIDGVDANVKVQMLEWQNKQAGKKEKLNEAFASGKISKASTFAAKSEELEENTGVRMVWELVEKDASKTPKEYLVPDTEMIEEALRNDKKVAGWAWEQVQHIAI